MTDEANAELAELIACEITRQGQEHDGLGDAESIVLMGHTPTINLLELAGAILAARSTESATSNAAIEAAAALLFCHAQWKGDAYTAGTAVKGILATIRKVDAR